MKFLIPPESEGYSVSYGEEVIRTQLEGGQGRYRSDIFNASRIVECSWKLNAEQFDYAGAFYRAVAKYGSVPFEIDLIVDSPQLLERTVNIVPGSWQLTGQQGLGYFLKATLEVHPTVLPESEDLDIVEAYNEEYGN
jgi:hypothetical protein